MLQELFHLFRAEPLFFAAAMGVFGLMVGSFLNVVIHRLPLMMEREWRQDCQDLLASPTEGSPSPAATSSSEGKPPSAGATEAAAAALPAEKAAEPYNLVVPRSRCPVCARQITALENIPLLSYLALRGRCRGCGTHIPWRYPLVEALAGMVAAGIALHYGFGLQAIAAIFLAFALIALAGIDLQHQLLPDQITLPFLWLGIGVNLFDGGFVDLRASVLGAMAGYLFLWVAYWLFKLCTGKEGMGYGDFKLLALLGAWCGWQGLPWIVLLSCLVGAIVGIALIASGRHAREVPIPFGPYLAAAGFTVLLWGQKFTSTYLAWMASPN
jgi:leader peptidase (prepilin peptidase)/N-methyltransferase